MHRPYTIDWKIKLLSLEYLKIRKSEGRIMYLLSTKLMSLVSCSHPKMHTFLCKDVAGGLLECP